MMNSVPAAYQYRFAIPYRNLPAYIDIVYYVSLSG